MPHRPAALLLLALSLPAAADDAARTNYLYACRGCHLADGSGVPPEVPSLRETLGGLASSRTGRDYLVQVPGVLQSRLDDREVAEVLNWVLLEMNPRSLPADFAPLTEQEVAVARARILADPVGYRRGLRAESATN